jgi:hypothetical protein
MAGGRAGGHAGLSADGVTCACDEEVTRCVRRGGEPGRDGGCGAVAAGSAELGASPRPSSSRPGSRARSHSRTCNWHRSITQTRSSPRWPCTRLRPPARPCQCTGQRPALPPCAFILRSAAASTPALTPLAPVRSGRTRQGGCEMHDIVMQELWVAAHATRSPSFPFRQASVCTGPHARPPTPSRFHSLIDQVLCERQSSSQRRTRSSLRELAGGRTALEVAPEVEDLPHAEREERAEREEEEVAHPVVGRLCGQDGECMRCASACWR